jgi:hypothetical protein
MPLPPTPGEHQGHPGERRCHTATIPGQTPAGLGLTQPSQLFHRLHPQPSYTINRGAHQFVTQTTRSSLLSFHFLELDLVVWKLESS